MGLVETLTPKGWSELALTLGTVALCNCEGVPCVDRLCPWVAPCLAGAVKAPWGAVLLPPPPSPRKASEVLNVLPG